MRFVAELDWRELQLALLFDVGLQRPVDHDVADVGVVEQLLERAEAEQLVDQHLLERELLAAVEGDLELGQHLHDDRAKFLAQLFLRERRRGFGVHPFEEAREDLFLDLVDRRLEAADFGLVIVDGVGAIGQSRHCIAAIGRAGRRGRLHRGRFPGNGRELLAATGRDGRGATLHRLRDPEARAGPRSHAAHSVLAAECAHSRPSLLVKSAHAGSDPAAT